MSELYLKTFNLPDLGEGLSEAEIVAWHVAAGDHVVTDQPLVSVETAKAVVEIPSPQSGRIETIYGAPGEMVNIGSPLVTFEKDDGTSPDAIVGELPHTDVPARHVERSRPQVQRPGIRVAPAVRRLAAELEVNLSSLNGSGVEGAITREDVQQAAEAGMSFPGGEPVRGPRRAMAQLMSKAGREVVHATVTDSAVIDLWEEDEDPTVRLIQAIAAGCKAEPRLNAWFDGGSNKILIHQDLDLGIAMDTPEGLFVPVLRGVQDHSVESLRAQLEQLKDGVRNRTLTPQQLTGQTLTLSNFGMLAGRYASLVVAPPQVAILGAGRIEDRVIVRSNDTVVAPVLPLSLSFDHRAVTGGDATRFLAAVIGSLEGRSQL